MAERLKNPHPGDFLREGFLEPWRKSAYWLAKGTGLSPIAVSQILRGQRSITAATALRLSRFLGTSPEFWLNYQRAYDLEEARHDEKLAAELQKIVPVDHDALPVYLDDEGEPVAPAEAVA
jgi:antitoxin HigA-1